MKFSKIISSSLAIGLLFNSAIPTLASILSEDGRYETFEGNNITIDDILEEDKVDVEIEGNTMVNVANQKDPVPITNSYIIEGTNHIPLQGEYDGKARPVIEGNTLVNLYSNSPGFEYYRDDTPIWTSKLPSFNLKEDKKYTLIIKGNSNLSKIAVCNGDGNNQMISMTTVINGYYKGTFIYNSSYSENRIYMYSNSVENTQSVVDSLEVMLLEGDYTNKPLPEYFEGIQSSFEDQLVTQEMVDSGQEKAENLGKYKVEYKVTGKNKLSGVISSDNDGFKLDNLIDGVKYTIKGDDSITHLKISTSRYSNSLTDDVIFDCHTNKWSFVYRDDKDYKLYVWTNSEVNNSNDYENLKIQIEEGSTATKYEPYKESIKTFYLNSPLLEGDTIEDIDGKATHVRRYEKVVLDGSEDWILNNVAVDDTLIRFRFLPEYICKDNLSTILCDRFPLNRDSLSKETVLCYEQYGIVIGILKSKLPTPDINGFKQWLSDNPTTLVYELKTPIYETISEESILIDSYKDGHLDLNTDVPVNKVDFVPTTTNLNYLYPSTEYTVQFESDNVGKIDRVLLGNEVLYGNYIVNKGINRFNITTPGDTTSNKLVFDGIGFNLSNLIVTEATDESFDYFEGIKSVGQDNVNGHKIEIVSTNSDRTQSNKIEIPLSEPLRAVGDVKDRIIKRNGQWVIERNLEEVILDGSHDEEYRTIDDEFSNVKWFGFTLKNKQLGIGNSISNKFINSIAWDNIELLQDATNYNKWNCNTYISINKDKLLSIDIDGFKHWLKSNPVRIVYKLSEPTYEPLNIDSAINTYLDITHISNDSTIPANMKVTVDRAINRAVEAIELAKINPTVSNISEARMWSNLLKESIKKDELHNEITNITNIEDLQLERKTTSANVDIYIKSENSLSMTLSTNSIMFEDYSGVNDIEKLNALEITINSSLPYDLNAYLESEIQNSDKSTTMDSNLLQIKESSNLNYKTFNNTTDKVILEEDCTSGNYNKHNIDLKIEGSNAYKADVYKAVIKFEAQQK